MTEQQAETSQNPQGSQDLSASEAEEVHQDPPENSEPPSTDPDDQDQFSREYVQQLRKEAKAHRLKAQRVDQLEEHLRALSIKHWTAPILNDPETLSWTDDLADADGNPDPQKITEAAENLLKSKPWLGRVRGHLPGMGEHSDTEARLSLSELLRG